MRRLRKYIQRHMRIYDIDMYMTNWLQFICVTDTNYLYYKNCVDYLCDNEIRIVYTQHSRKTIAFPPWIYDPTEPLDLKNIREYALEKYGLIWARSTLIFCRMRLLWKHKNFLRRRSAQTFEGSWPLIKNQSVSDWNARFHVGAPPALFWTGVRHAIRRRYRAILAAKVAFWRSAKNEKHRILTEKWRCEIRGANATTRVLYFENL